MTQTYATSRKSPETVSHLISLLRDFNAATLVTRNRSDCLHGRPMSIAAIDDDTTIWFITSVRSAKVDEVSEDARAMATLQSGSRFVCLNGHVEIVFDRSKIKALWKDSYRVWYEDQNDPDIVLLRFTPFDAEYWDSSGIQGLKYAFQAARAYIKGEKLEQKPELGNDTDSHAKLKLWDPSDAAGPDL